MTSQKKQYLQKAFEAAKVQYSIATRSLNPPTGLKLTISYDKWLKTPSGKASADYYDKNVKAKVETGNFNVNEFLNSPAGLQSISSVNSIIATLAGKNAVGVNQGGFNADAFNVPDESLDDPKNETTILGMSPLTFGIVTVVSLVAISAIVIIAVKSSSKAVPAA